jgi:hypothetical protein
MSEAVLCTLQNNVKGAHQGFAPSNLQVDHQKADNPYLLRYGEEKWLGNIYNTTAFTKVMCITKVTEHIVRESETVFKGT